MRISQSLQTWLSPGDPTKGPATMWTSYALMTWLSDAGSLIAGGSTVANAARGIAQANSARQRKRMDRVMSEEIVVCSLQSVVCSSPEPPYCRLQTADCRA